MGNNQFLNSIVRGAGYTVGRNLINDARQARKESEMKREFAAKEAINSSINRLLGVDVISKVKDEIEKHQQAADAILKRKRSEEGFLFKMMSFFMRIGLGIFLWIPIGLTIKFTIGINPISLLIGWTLCFLVLPHFMLPKLIKHEEHKRKKYEEYIQKNIAPYEKLLNIYEQALKKVREIYNHETEEMFRKREVTKGMPLDPFVIFFGEPVSREVTDESVTLVYGTSKHSGDWFRFRNGQLSEYSIK